MSLANIISQQWTSQHFHAKEMESMARSLDLNELSREDLFDLLEMTFDRLTVEDLLRVRVLADTKRQEKLEDAKNALRVEVQSRLAGMGLTLDDLMTRRTTKKGGRRTQRATGRAVPVKYRGMNGETWSGRGHVPQWIRDLEEQGRDRGEFLVTQDNP